MLPEGFHREIFADLLGKERQGAARKKGKMVNKRRKIVREGGKILNGWEKRMKMGRGPFFLNN